MNPHNWETEEVDGHMLGIDDFWYCTQCGCAGGPVGLFRRRDPKPFWADGSGLQLPEDCDEAQAVIAKHLLDRGEIE